MPSIFPISHALPVARHYSIEFFRLLLRKLSRDVARGGVDSQAGEREDDEGEEEVAEEEVGETPRGGVAREIESGRGDPALEHEDVGEPDERGLPAVEGRHQQQGEYETDDVAREETPDASAHEIAARDKPLGNPVAIAG